MAVFFVVLWLLLRMNLNGCFLCGVIVIATNELNYVPFVFKRTASMFLIMHCPLHSLKNTSFVDVKVQICLIV